MKKITKKLSELFNFKSLTDSIADALPEIIVAFIILLLSFFMWKAIRRTLLLIFRKTKVDLTLQKFILTVLKITITTIAIITSLGQIGVNISSIIASFGIIGFTVGFAAKDTLSNIISGLFILWDRPFVIDDLIEVKNHYGRVDNITLRSTRIVTTDGKMLAIPNSTVINEVVASYTNFPNLRIEATFTIDAHSDLQKIKQQIDEIIADQDAYLKSIPAELVIANINTNLINVVYRVWIKDERQHIQMQDNLQRSILSILREFN